MNWTIKNKNKIKPDTEQIDIDQNWSITPHPAKKNKQTKNKTKTTQNKITKRYLSTALNTERK